MLPKKKTPDEAQADLYIKNLPRAVLRAAKARCALLGVTLREKVISLLREWVRVPDEKEKD